MAGFDLDGAIGVACWLATNRDGETFVVEAMVSNPDVALSEDSTTDLVALAGDAFGLLDEDAS